MLDREEIKKDVYMFLDGEWVQLDLEETLKNYSEYSELVEDDEDYMSDEILDEFDKYIETMVDELENTDENNVSISEIIEVSNMLLFRRRIENIIDKYEGE